MEWMSEQRARRPFGIVGTYFLITQLSGVAILVIWAFEILQRSKSSVDPQVGNIIFGTKKVVSGFFTSSLDFKNGTTPLALISGLGVGLFCLVVGIYVNCDKNHYVLPQICYVIYVIFATIGHYTLPLLIILELYPSQIRGIVAEISLSNACFLIFAANVCYPQLRDLLGFDNSLTSFGVCTLLGCLYLYFCLTETKGLTLHQIEGYFNEIRPKLTSQKKKIMQNFNRNMAYGPSARNMNCYVLRSKIN
ncbi:facilitated trehalose transporter Tret1-like [Aricia agestis]|uniref:facilitated trehalose transporter Tret1-like n=1 Tax=Aricia agestis TaxID=91739 RepID=UPI001C20B892|nr:facilitated trehalose transporter Tret1-like [Aricia agestis]